MVFHLTGCPEGAWIGGGSLTGFSNATVDGDLVIFECFAAGGGNARYGFFGCFLDDGVPGEIFEILTNAQPLDGRPIADLTMSPGGRDGYRFAFDVRHAANSASLYVATVQRASSGCPADFAEPFGTLNFFDVAAYIDAFNAQDPSTDLDANGQSNFFDVAAYLASYNAGCP